MEYRAVGSRCAIDLNCLNLSVSRKTVLDILNQNGFMEVDVDMISLARQCIGVSKYRRAARPSEAPNIVDCSSFVKWLYAQRGIWLPRRTIQQRQYGKTVDINELTAGDLIFLSGRLNYYDDDTTDGVGHVGIATSKNTVIHAVNSRVNIIEVPLDVFVDKSKYRGTKRYIPKDADLLTLETPPQREIEVADDIKWVIFQYLKNKQSGKDNIV
ncbi:MAG: NLP/P60 protein [Parcubacteria group bacterium GW2011_GWA2_42_14]|nr:MAG: NLP/P60 protein [Parcubacteria group bacterium GW2011_GWA2_42_14]